MFHCYRNYSSFRIAKQKQKKKTRDFNSVKYWFLGVCRINILQFNSSKHTKMVCLFGKWFSSDATHHTHIKLAVCSIRVKWSVFKSLLGGSPRFCKATTPNFSTAESSVEIATWHICYTSNKHFKRVTLNDIGVTTASTWWRHGFYAVPIFSTSKPQLLKWLSVRCWSYLGLPDWKVLKTANVTTRG